MTDSKNSTKSGRFLEVLGNYDARRGEKAVFNTEKVSYWMSKGAQVSDTVHNMLVDKKVISAKKINKLPLKKAIVKEVPVVEQSSLQDTATTSKNIPVEDSVVVEAPVVEETPAPALASEEAPVVEETPASAPEEAPVVEQSSLQGEASKEESSESVA